MNDRDSHRIIRQWDGEIDAELRRDAARRQRGPWQAVVWGALWCVWLALLVGLVALVRPLR